MDAKVAPGEDEKKIKTELEALRANSWEIDEDQMGVEKTYYFPNYTKALDFVSTVGIRSKSKAHHSTMTIKFGSVYVHWTTHKPRGLTAKDTFMANICDEQAKLIGAVEQAAKNSCG